MSLDDLQPGNSKRARATAVKAFSRFLQSDNANLSMVRAAFSGKNLGSALCL